MYSNIYQPSVQVPIQMSAHQNRSSNYDARQSYYILPMDNNVELGSFAGKFVAPVRIVTEPNFKDGYLNIDFSFTVAGQWELPPDAFYCNVSVLDQVVRNVPLYCSDATRYGSPNLYTYQGHVQINLVQNWISTPFHNTKLDIQFAPFLNPDIPNKYEIVVGGGKFQEFLNEWKQFCCFHTYYELSNYFDQEELSQAAYNNWQPSDYIYDYQTGVLPVIKKLTRPNYYFQPKQDEFCLSQPLFCPFYTNATQSPKQIFAEAKLILDYQVQGQASKQLVYNYNLVDNNPQQEFNLGFKSVYDLDKHELKLVPSSSEVGSNGIYFPEPTTFSLRYIFKDKNSFGLYYTGQLLGRFDQDLFANNKEIDLEVSTLDSQANGEWLGVNN